MLRRFIIPIVTFAVLLAAYLAYKVASEGSLLEGRHLTQNTPANAGKTTTVPKVGAVSPGRGLRLLQYDKVNNLRAKYTSTYWYKVAGDRYGMEEPTIEWYLTNGDCVYIRANKGMVSAKDVAGDYIMNDGVLTGNVWIVMDRHPDPDVPLDRRPEDAMRIHVDQIEFDKDLLNIKSTSQVSVFMREGDMLGTGLHLAWSEKPRQLRELRIDQGQYMCIREGQDRFVKDLSLPGGTSAGNAGATAAESAAVSPGSASKPRGAADAGAIRPGRGEFTAASSRAAGKPVTTARAGAAIVAVTTSSSPTTTPGVTPVVPDNYVATFADNVVVTCGTRFLRGADTLRVVFEYKSSDKERTRPGNAPTASSAPGIAAVAAAAAGKPDPGEFPKSLIPATVPVISPVRPVAAAGPGKGLSEPAYITWSGPLVVVPYRSMVKPQPKNVQIVADGAHLDLGDGDARAACQHLEFYSPDRRGLLTSHGAEPVVIEQANGQRITAPSVEYNRLTGEVDMVGAGTMFMPAAAGGGAAIAAAGADDKSPQGDMNVAWSKIFHATLGEQDVADKAQRRDYLHSATFVGDVFVDQGKGQTIKTQRLEADFHAPRSTADQINRIAELRAFDGVDLDDTATGEFIKSDNLKVVMSLPAEPKAYPRSALATGHVRASQQKMGITADKLAVTFVSALDEKTKQTKVKPVQLDATGSVKVKDARNPDQPVDAECDELVSNMTDNTAVLTGAPAKVLQKDNRLEGAKIIMYQQGQKARVEGPGNLHFLSNTDISGNKSDRARPVDIDWQTGMDYSGADRLATVTGKVNLVTAGDKLKCGILDVYFIDAATSQPTSAPAAGAPVAAAPARAATTTSAPGLAMAFKPQSIAKVHARNDAVLESTQKDESFLRTRVTLWSDSVLYRVADKNVVCDGPGRLVMEDYRPPAKAKPEAAATPAADDGLLPGGSVNSPSQTAFKWKDSMSMDQATRKVAMYGGVVMAHRSGNEIVKPQEPTRPWGELKTGRNTAVNCDYMTAEFAAAPAAAAATATAPVKSASPIEGMTMGPLQMFEAIANARDPKDAAYLKDGPREMWFRRLLYNHDPAKDKDVAVIWGYLENEPLRNARVITRGQAAGNLDSPKILWDRKTNKFEARDVSSAGGK